MRKGRIIHEHLNGQDSADDVGVRYGIPRVSTVVQRYHPRTIGGAVVDREVTPEALLETRSVCHRTE